MACSPISADEPSAPGYARALEPVPQMRRRSTPRRGHDTVDPARRPRSGGRRRRVRTRLTSRQASPRVAARAARSHAAGRSRFRAASRLTGTRTNVARVNFPGRQVLSSAVQSVSTLLPSGSRPQVDVPSRCSSTRRGSLLTQRASGPPSDRRSPSSGSARNRRPSALHTLRAPKPRAVGAGRKARWHRRLRADGRSLAVWRVVPIPHSLAHDR